MSSNTYQNKEGEIKIRKLYLMKCGHIANAVDSAGNPICAICTRIKPEAYQVDREVSGTEGLEGRKAKCDYCNMTQDSNWGLPFFRYQSDCKTDSFYCGCRGWD